MTTVISITALTTEQAADLREIAAWGLADRAQTFIQCSPRFGDSTSAGDEEARLAAAVHAAGALNVNWTPGAWSPGLTRDDLSMLREHCGGIIDAREGAEDPDHAYWSALVETVARARLVLDELEATLGPPAEACPCCGRPPVLPL